MINRLTGLDIETTGLDPLKDKVVAVGIYDYETGASRVLQSHKDNIKEELEQLSSTLIIIHNAKFDMAFIYQEYGIIFPNYYCTFMASRVLMNGLDFSNSLINCLSHYLGVKEDIHINKKELSTSFHYGRELTPDQVNYITGDIAHLPKLYLKLDAAIKADNLEGVLELEHKLLPVIIRMENIGVRIDTVQMAVLIGEWERSMKKIVPSLDAEVSKLYGKMGKMANLFVTINYSSNSQVIGLFKDLGQPIPINSDGKQSVDYDSLQSYINEDPTSVMVDFIKHLVDYREYSKLISTYGKTLMGKIVKGYLHGSFNQLGTDTGRLSSSSPNLQNIPSGGTGGEVRKCFVADPGHVMITSDMQAAEVRLAADFSGDKLLLGSILEGLDMHSKLASVSYSIIFGQPFEVSKSTAPVMVRGVEVIPNELRDIHKSATFCKFYKGGPRRIYGVLSRYINLFHKKQSLKISKQISEALDAELVGLSAYLTRTIEEANKTLKLRGKLGRVRYFQPGVYGEAANFGIQNANSEAIKMAMVDVDRYLTENGYGRVVMSIHDELVCSVKKENAEQAAVKIKELMSSSLGYFLTRLKGDASVTIKPYWSK